MSRKTTDLTNQRFNNLVVIKREENAPSGDAQWLCQCDCGNTTIVTSHNLRTNHTKSCGCLKNIHKPKFKNINNYSIIDDYVLVTTVKNIMFKIDIDDILLVQNYHWSINKRGYVVSNTQELLHRIIMNPPPNKVIDHKNGDKLDNRRKNLRICDMSHNAMNKVQQKNNTSGIIGVNFYKAYNKWRAYITVNKKRINLGYFESLEEAIEQRKKAEEKYFKEFSLDNSRGCD